MITPFEKIKRTLSYHYFRIKKEWFFPRNIAHVSATKMAKGTYEPGVTQILKRRLSKDSVFVDVGANIGYFTKIAADIVKPKGEVYAFEAEYDNYHALFRNTGSLPSVTPMHFAVTDTISVMELNHSSHSACHSLVETDNHLDGDTFTVPTITIDHFWTQYLDQKAIDVIKIDVEGAELHVLEGMSRILSLNKIGTIIIEYCPMVLYNSGQDPYRIFEVLKRGFSLSIIDKKYRSLQKNRVIENLREFRHITEYLLEFKSAVNINLLCERM